MTLKRENKRPRAEARRGQIAIRVD